MKAEEFKQYVRRVYMIISIFFGLIIMCSVGLIYIQLNPSLVSDDKLDNSQSYVSTEIIDFDRIENGIHIATGFKDGEGLQNVIASCTPCHSSKLVTQNRATKEGWIGLIRWMQKTQNLWDLGANEDVIVNYLATYYAPEDMGRREVLSNIEWYELED